MPLARAYIHLMPIQLHRPVLIGLGLLLLSCAQAADIVLKDSRVLKEARIVSQTPRNVTVRHAGGLSSVPKILLPEELLAKYPVDEVAAKASEARAAEARAARHAEEQGKVASTAPQPAPGHPEAPAAATSESSEQATVISLVQTGAAEYFSALNKADFAGVEIDVVSAPSAAGGTWTVRGRARFVHYPQSYSQWRARNPAGEQTLKEHRRAFANTAKVRYQKFETSCKATDTTVSITALSRW